MPPTTSIPRFLLPQRGTIWRSNFLTTSTIRNASHKATKKPSKPLVLEKPTKFNPPSHGARLRKDPPRYPGPQLSAEDAAQQKTKQYPNMMPPEGSVLHWFIHSKTIHLWISLSTLSFLAGFVFITNFRRNSPFADMLPEWSSLFFRPIATVRTFLEVMKLDAEHNTAETMERRRLKVEDVGKRAQYRKAHGLDKDEGFGGWTVKSDAENMGPAMVLGDGKGLGGVEDAVNESSDVSQESQPPVREKKQLKKWLGIW